MKLPCLLFALLACNAVCQEPSALTGTVEKLAHGVLLLRTGRQLFAVRTDDRTVVWKERREQRVSALNIGEKVRVRLGMHPSGDDFATRVSATTVTFSGVAGRDLAGRCGPEAARRFSVGQRGVCMTPETAAGPGRPFVAKMVHVVGWDFGDGTVDATRIAVYNTDLPVNIPRP